MVATGDLKSPVLGRVGSTPIPGTMKLLLTRIQNLIHYVLQIDSTKENEMSACQQAKRKRSQMRNGYAHMSGSLRRPRISGVSHRSVAESIQAARNAAARAAKMSSKKKTK